MDIKLIDVPLCVGSPTDGSEFAGSVISEELNKELKLETVKLNNLNLRTNLPTNMKNLESVMDTAKKVRDEVYNTILNKKFPIVLGGDHSLSIGSITATSEIYSSDDLLILYVDAHADINSEMTSESGNIHGMPLGATLGITSPKLSLTNSKKMINGKNIYNISGRSIDRMEYANINNEGVTIYDFNKVKEMGISNIMNEIKMKTNATKVHFSFDVDSLDPSEFTSTGYVLNNGLTKNDILEMVDFVVNNFKLVLFECVEYNPSLDSDKNDLNVIIDILNEVIEKVRKTN